MAGFLLMVAINFSRYFPIDEYQLIHLSRIVLSKALIHKSWALPESENETGSVITHAFPHKVVPIFMLRNKLFSFLS